MLTAGGPADRRAALSVAALLLAGACSSQGASTPFTEGEYQTLLARFPASAQGFGPDPYLTTPMDHLEIYAILLSAEARRFAATRAPDAADRVRRCWEMLLGTADADGDGKPGWGLPFAWDAFGDGSVNPANHPYTISTAQALEALLDALELAPDLFSRGELLGAEDLVRRTWSRWSAEAFTQQGERGWFWYSTATEDAYDVANVNGMMLSVAVRLAGHAWLTAEPALVADAVARARTVAATLVADLAMRQGLPFWRYVPVPNAIAQDEPNDAVHHVYTLWGLERFRDSRLGPPLPYGRAEAGASLRRFEVGGVAYDYPQDVKYSGDQAGYATRPMILWGTGALLAFLGEFGPPDPKLEATLHALLVGPYGPWPDLRLWPAAFSDDPAFYPRYADHVLWGLACRLYSAPFTLPGR